VLLSLAFNGLFWWAIHQDHGAALANEKGMEFLTGYLIEKSLAVDNIFVFLMIFTYFAVPPELQKRVLMIGIIGAIVLRTVMILVGAWLIQQFHWVLYVFGAFLVVTGIKMWWAAGQEPDLESNPALKLLRRLLPVSKSFAILGLRAMYFLLAAVAVKFHRLRYGLAVVLAFIGTKLLLIGVVKIPVAASLGAVVAMLAVTMALSVAAAPRIASKPARTDA
jgi:tellurite resistance protein TerC